MSDNENNNAANAEIDPDQKVALMILATLQEYIKERPQYTIEGILLEERRVGPKAVQEIFAVAKGEGRWSSRTDNIVGELCEQWIGEKFDLPRMEQALQKKDSDAYELYQRFLTDPASRPVYGLEKGHDEGKPWSELMPMAKMYAETMFPPEGGKPKGRSK